MTLDLTKNFISRHLGPRVNDLDAMVRIVGASSIEALIEEVIPKSIRLREPLGLQEAQSEADFLSDLRKLAAKNQEFRSFIGLGYYGNIIPSVILRNVLENPGWYTPYTPYQAEVSQGRLEGLLNFQTMVQDLTAMDIANASLLDEATAAAEAMSMLHRLRERKPGRASRFVVASTCFPQTVEVVKGRAEPLGIKVEIVDPKSIAFDIETFGLLLQYPDADGAVEDLKPSIERAHKSGVGVIVATDLLALTMLVPPGEQGADVVVGSAQRFGVPIGYGGPHAAFFSTRKSYVRQIPGRLIGVTIDSHNRLAYRMSLQTREQHIRRERATSNICTAQALLANIAGFYAVYHGPSGLSSIARRVHALTSRLASNLESLGINRSNERFFDTLRLKINSEKTVAMLRTSAEEAKINFRYFGNNAVGISLDETTTASDVNDLLELFARAKGKKSIVESKGLKNVLPDKFLRKSAFLKHDVFNRYHSEIQMMRYLKKLERKDIGLDTSMIPLGSCTMKLNAATQMIPITWTAFSSIHPFAPLEQATGYHEVFAGLQFALRAITGLADVSLQPNSGAQGEFAGLMVIRAYQDAQDEGNRDIALIPSSAHGTNPASAAMAGMRIVFVDCDKNGNVDLVDLRSKASMHRSELSALMITYPSTHGVFEESIQDICEAIHVNGGQVYMDGANMNAQLGLTSPAKIGADVCHLNLHKTFAIPHGGGGPGMGPIAVAKHLSPYLPGHEIIQTGGSSAIRAVSAAPWGSASILLISYGYIKLLGGEGVTQATSVAILNANYLKARLEEHYSVLYSSSTGRVAHELIFDLRPFKSKGVTEQDVAKRLMDYGFHAPTVSFPVPGTLMVEPTESEPLEELDRFCDAMISIRQEIQEVIEGKVDPLDNVLKNAPHTASEIANDDWSHPYSRERAVFPLPFVRANKFWPTISRINDAHGDRNLVCACPPLSAYGLEEGISESVSRSDI